MEMLLTQRAKVPKQTDMRLMQRDTLQPQKETTLMPRVIILILVEFFLTQRGLIVLRLIIVHMLRDMVQHLVAGLRIQKENLLSHKALSLTQRDYRLQLLETILT